MKILLLLIFVLTVAFADDSIRAQNFIRGSQHFAADVYTEILKTGKNNFIVSPLSVQLVLALARLGAKGKTAQELSTALRIPEDDSEIEKTFEEITPHLSKDDPYILATANKIYVKDGLELNENYKNSATKYFNAEVENVQFLDSSTARKINAWVAEHTFNRIQGVVQPSSFNGLTQSLLINTMYFKGFWEHAFQKEFTKQKPFFLNKSEQKQTDTMKITSKFRYSYNDNLKAQFVELPYKGGDISMTIVLPSDKDGLSQLESQLAKVSDEQSYYNANVDLQMPKFTIESTIEFNSILQNLGIKEGFKDSANFTGIGKTNNVLFKISSVLQKALIEVDEEGTTAAAATTVMLVRPIAALIPVTFTADHPFIYFLKSKSVGVLFVGRFVSP